MKYLIFTTLLVSLSCVIQAQEKKNSIQFEAGGNGFLYSLNYERLELKHLSLRGGISFIRVQEKGTNKDFNIGTLPINASYLMNIYHNRHFIELGVGVNLVYLSSTMNSFIRETDLYLNPTANVGYRLHSSNGRWIYRVAITPFYGTRSLIDKRPNQLSFALLSRGIQIWGGISVGYRF